jgi:hypothetical protein
MFEIRPNMRNFSNTKAVYSAHSSSVDLLSNSSFNYLNMYRPDIPARSSSQNQQLSPREPRSRQPTDASTGSKMTSYEILEAQRLRVSEIKRFQDSHNLQSPGQSSDIEPFQYTHHLASPDHQNGNVGDLRRVPAPRCPPVAERREGASLPRSPGMQNLEALLKAEEFPGLQTGKLLREMFQYAANIPRQTPIWDLQPTCKTSRQTYRRRYRTCKGEGGASGNDHGHPHSLSINRRDHPVGNSPNGIQQIRPRLLSQARSRDWHQDWTRSRIHWHPTNPRSFDIRERHYLPPSDSDAKLARQLAIHLVDSRSYSKPAFPIRFIPPGRGAIRSVRKTTEPVIKS